MIRIPCCLAALSPLASPAAAATLWLVPSEVGTVAAALDSASAGDTVVVAPGTYLEHGLILPSGVTVRGATGDATDVVLDAQGLGRLLDGEALTGGGLESLTLVNGVPPASPPEEARGGALRLRGSAAFAVSNCVFAGNGAKHGGAISCESSSITIEDCEFQGNAAAGNAWATGGAIRVDGGTPVVLRCTFTGNSAFAEMVLGDGGAIFARATDGTVEDCVFAGNSAGAGAGACYGWEGDATRYERCSFDQNVADAGGALYLETSMSQVVDCDFTSNQAENGGAVFVDQWSSPRFRDCRFTGNTASPNAGGALDVWASTPEIRNCTFAGNSAGLGGGAVSLNGSTQALVEECTFAGNAAATGGAVQLAATASATVESSTIVESGGGAIRLRDSATLLVDRSIVAFSTDGRAVRCTESSSADLVDCDVHGNPGGDWTDCIAGQLGVNGNVSADPRFCDRAGGDWSLELPDSPCLPQNSPSGFLVGRWPAGCGCPSAAIADILVPAQHPTIAAALAAASPGDVVGVCSGTYAEAVSVKAGVHLVGAAANLCRVEWPGGPEPALLWARGVLDSTVVSDLTFDGMGAAPAVVLAESTTTGLHLARDVITGGQADGIVNGPDSRVRIGGALEYSNDVFGNGGATPRNVRNLNVAADSLDALLNYWGMQAYDAILAAIEGPVRSCPITDSTHTAELCAPLTALSSPSAAASAPLGLAAWPNPFRGSCRIALSVREAGEARLAVFDVRGRRVVSLLGGRLGAGAHGLAWDGRDEAGTPVPPGVYFLRLDTAPAAATRKLVRLR